MVRIMKHIVIPIPQFYPYCPYITFRGRIANPRYRCRLFCNISEPSGVGIGMMVAKWKEVFLLVSSVYSSKRKRKKPHRQSVVPKDCIDLSCNNFTQINFLVLDIDYTNIYRINISFMIFIKIGKVIIRRVKNFFNFLYLFFHCFIFHTILKK